VITVLLLIETAVLALVVVLVVGLLRSHAEILRRLAALEGNGADGGAVSDGGAVPEHLLGASAGAFDIVGQTLAGDSVKVRLGPGSPTTLLAFLSSGCAACGPLWEGLQRDARIPAGARLVIVVKGPQEESASRLRELAPSDRELLMSPVAWRDYSIPGSPHFVLVDGRSGAIAGRGTAASWEQMVTMVEQALSDGSQSAVKAGRSRARTTSERAGRAEQALAAAGIAAGHPSLYPAEDPPGVGQRA